MQEEGRRQVGERERGNEVVTRMLGLGQRVRAVGRFVEWVVERDAGGRGLFCVAFVLVVFDCLVARRYPAISRFVGWFQLFDLWCI